MAQAEDELVPGLAALVRRVVAGYGKRRADGVPHGKTVGQARHGGYDGA